MKISISVSPIWKAQKLSDRELWESLRDCGFRYLCEEFDLSSGSAAGIDAAARRALWNDCGVTPVKARIRCARPFAETEELKALFPLCAALGISQAVIPLGTEPDNDRWTYFSNNRRYLESLLPAARDAGLTLLIENAGNYQSAHFTHTGTELTYFLEYLGCPEGLKLDLNIGHQGMIDANLYADTRAMAKNIASIDASDNFFAMPLGVEKDREDLALVPLMGFLDFDESFLALKEAGYDGVYNLTLNTPRVFDKTSPYVKEPKLSLMPLPLLKRYYAWAYKVTAHMLTTYGYQVEGGEKE